MTGQARAWFNVSPFAPSLPEQIDDARASRRSSSLVDGFTALGGAQWIDSPAIGDYGTYLCEDVVGLRRRALPHPSRRGAPRARREVLGRLRRGVWALLRPDLFGGFATHAGDALFEVTLAAEFAPAAQALRNLYGGSFERFWEDFRSGRPVLENRTDPLLQNVYADAAAFSPAGGEVELPFRLDTGELVPEVWERWLAWDPVRLAPRHAEALPRAARDLDRRRPKRRVPARPRRDRVLGRGRGGRRPERRVHFELFDGGHRGLNRRLPLSLAFLAERLAG